MKPTRAQEEKWTSFKKRASRLFLSVKANEHRANALNIALDFAAERKLEPPIWQMPGPFDRLITLQKKVAVFRRLIQGVEDEKIGLQFTNGDIDIVGAPSMTNDELQYWKGFSGPADMGWLLIAAGIVIVSTVIALVDAVLEENKNLHLQNNALLDDLNSRYCQVPGSELCSAWLQRKEEKGYKKELSWAEEFQKAAAKVGSTLTTGAGWGIALAIPLLAWILIGKRR